MKRAAFSTLFAAGILALGCNSKEPQPKSENVAQAEQKQAGHPHDGVPGADGAGANPHGANPHGANPHGANPHGAGGPKAPPMGPPKVAVDWTVPKSWKVSPRKSMMRVATYEAPGEAGAAEVTVFYFGPNQGGGVEMNIERWIKQFGDKPADAVERSTRDVNGLKQHLVSVSEGTFSSGMPGGAKGPQTKWGLYAGIVEAPSGSYFFKMTGPSATVAANKAAFLELLDTVKPKS